MVLKQSIGKLWNEFLHTSVNCEKTKQGETVKELEVKFPSTFYFLYFKLTLLHSFSHFISNSFQSLRAPLVLIAQDLFPKILSFSEIIRGKCQHLGCLLLELLFSFLLTLVWWLGQRMWWCGSRNNWFSM